MCVGTYCSKFHWHTLNVFPDTAWITVIIHWLVGRKLIVDAEWKILDSGLLCDKFSHGALFLICKEHLVLCFEISLAFDLIAELKYWGESPGLLSKIEHFRQSISHLLMNEQLRVNDRVFHTCMDPIVAREYHAALIFPLCGHASGFTSTQTPVYGSAGSMKQPLGSCKSRSQLPYN